MFLHARTPPQGSSPKLGCTCQPARGLARAQRSCETTGAPCTGTVVTHQIDTARQLTQRLRTHVRRR